MVSASHTPSPSAKSTYWYLENFNLFKGLGPADKAELERLAIVEQKVRQSVVYQPADVSDTLFLVKYGKIKISRLAPDGRELVLDILGPGEIFGELSLTGQGSRGEVAQATEETLVCGFRAADFEGFLHRNPDLNLRVLKLVGLRFRKVQVRLENLFFRNATERITDFIIGLAVERGQRLADGVGIVVKLNLTHGDIAKLTATNRQKVTMVLKDLERRGLVKYDRKHFYIPDLRLLESAGDPT